uniref:Uncharacterized protein n=1 Tax=Aegilops tauschii TaxID=37682 RepID=M8BUC2_AEGTA
MANNTKLVPEIRIHTRLFTSCSSRRSSSRAWQAPSRLRTSFPGNWGTIPLMIVPAICNEEDSPFGDADTCKSLGLSYVSLSMAKRFMQLGNFFIWTHSYSVMKRSAQLYKKCGDPSTNLTKEENSGEAENGNHAAFLPLSSGEFLHEDVESDPVSSSIPSNGVAGSFLHYLRRAKELLVEILNELWSPPSVAALVGFTVGAIDKLRPLVTEEDGPLRVVQDTAKLLADAAIPCTVLILGGNLTKGRGRTTMKPLVVISITVIRFVILPACGIGVVKAASELGFLPRSPLYRYVLLLQSTVPPAMSIGTIAQLFDVGEEECSIVFLWTHLVAALALTLWSTGELQLGAVGLRLHYFHMDHNTLQHSIAYVCSRLGYFLVHLVYYPVSPFVSLRRKIDGPFYAKPVAKKYQMRTRKALANAYPSQMMLLFGSIWKN